MVTPEPIRIVVAPEDAGERIDKLLASKDVASRATIQRWIAEGRVQVDGVDAVAKMRLKGGETIEVRPAAPPPSTAIPQDIPIDVVFEDDHLVVVNKAAGMVVHPAAGHPDGTLVNALLHHTTFEEGGDPMRPGIVHRLDKDTSGVMVVAKSSAARDALTARFKAHAIERRYEAIAVGSLPRDAMTFDTLYGRHPVARKRFSSKVKEGKQAITHVRVNRRVHAAMAIACELETGRTHQIRVHLSDAGCPVLGDPIYGKRMRDPRLIAAADAIGRLALHAALLGFPHPMTGEALRFEAPLPETFSTALELLVSGR